MSNVERPPSGERRWNRVVRGFSNLSWSEMASQLLRGGGGTACEGDMGTKRGREREERGKTREKNGYAWCLSRNREEERGRR